MKNIGGDAPSCGCVGGDLDPSAVFSIIVSLRRFGGVAVMPVQLTESEKVRFWK